MNSLKNTVLLNANMLSVALIDTATWAFLWGFHQFTFLPCVLVAQLCLSLSDPKNCSPPGSSVHGILQARILEQAAIPFSRGCSWCRTRSGLTHITGWVFTFWATRGGLTLPHRRRTDVVSIWLIMGKGLYLTDNVNGSYFFTWKTL